VEESPGDWPEAGRTHAPRVTPPRPVAALPHALALAPAGTGGGCGRSSMTLMTLSRYPGVGGGADLIFTGASDDNLQDILRFTATTDFGDTVNNFDTTGTTAQADRIEFTGALNTAYDDISNDDAFAFASGNGVPSNETLADLDTVFEAMFLAGTNGEGVTNANLGSASAVAAEFDAEFAIIASVDQDALLVVNDTDANSFALWHYVEAGTAEIQAEELTLIGIFNANGAVTINQLDLV
jgi:hypothetical protein